MHKQNISIDYRLTAKSVKLNSNSNLNNMQNNIRPRDYKCPCGKTYLSYPALFTHIKQKHNGKAPGNIEKPKKMARNRVIFKRISDNFIKNDENNGLNYYFMNNSSNFNKSKFIENSYGQQNQQYQSNNNYHTDNQNISNDNKNQKQQQSKSTIYWQQFSSLFNLIKTMDESPIQLTQILVNLQGFKKLQNYVDNNSQYLMQNNVSYNKSTKNYRQKQLQNITSITMPNACLGSNLLQFLKAVSLTLSSIPSSQKQNSPQNSHQTPSQNNFTQILILFSILLQYLHQQYPTTNIFQDCHIDVLIQYINPFMYNYIDKFIQDIDKERRIEIQIELQKQKSGLKQIWIMNKSNMYAVFMCFYGWVKFKGYTQFCITLFQ